MQNNLCPFDPATLECIGHTIMPLEKIVSPVLGMPRYAKRSIALLVDAALCILTVQLAYYLRLSYWPQLYGSSLEVSAVSLVMALPIFISMGLYRAIFRYAGLSAFMTVVKAVLIYGVAFATIFSIYGVEGVPKTVGFLQPLLLLIAISFSRILTRELLGRSYREILSRGALPKVLIYGAGNAGRQLAAAMNNSHQVNVVGYLDDDKNLHNNIMGGLKIFDPKDLVKLVGEMDVSFVLLAIPSASRARRNEILENMRAAKVTVRSMPDLTELARGNIKVSDTKELDIEDLLGRNMVAPNQFLLDKAIEGRAIMVTGAGGSIGSELCRQILLHKPSSLVVVDQSEFSLYTIHAELVKMTVSLALGSIPVIPFLGSVRDGDRMRSIMARTNPQAVYHAAAYKHVPLVEHNPVEGIRNNAFGTMITAQAALDSGVENFVLISTDKAVRPTNIMGASKRLAELVLQAMADDVAKAGKGTNFAMVRFGNVLGSSGSVVPLFRQQIREGGPITLTHPDITRYFMTIPEASQLVIQAGAMAEGGDVFVLDMGEPVKIIDLAKRMVELSGLTIRDAARPNGDIELVVTGLRPGEKLYEELLIGDNPQKTEHPLIMKAREDVIPMPELMDWLGKLENAMVRRDLVEIREILQKLVSGYMPTGEP